MGKKKDKYKNVYDNMSYVEKQKFLRREAENYGIDMGGYSYGGDPSGARGMVKGSYKDLEERLARESANNYANQRALEAAALSGNKAADKIKGMDEGINQLAATEKWMRKMKDKHVGGGAYTWGSDPTGVKDYFVNKDREKLTEDFVTQDQLSEYEKNQAANSDDQELKDIVLSEHMQKAKDIVDQWESGNAPPIFNEGLAVQHTGNRRSQIFNDIDIANLTQPSYFLENFKQSVMDDNQFQRVF